MAYRKPKLVAEIGMINK